MEKRSETGQLSFRVMPGKERPPLTRREKRELRYLFRRHCYVNEQSKTNADEKAVIARRIFELTGLYIENVKLPDIGGEASLDLDQLGFDPSVAEAITGPEVHQIAKQQNYFGHKLSVTLTGFYSSPEELAGLFETLKQLGPRWLLGEERHSAILNEPSYRSLCQSHNVPFPEPAIVPAQRSIKWMKPAKDPQPPRRSSRIRQWIERFREANRSRKKGRA